MQSLDGALFYHRFVQTTITADRSYTVPTKSGTLSLIDQIGGQNVNANITGPGAGQDGYVVSWNNGNSEYELVAAAAGGIANVVEDTTPQLGGNLDVQANLINTSVVNGNISIQPNGIGNVVLGNYTFDGDQTVGAGQDNYVLTYDNATGLISLEAAGGGADGNGIYDGSGSLSGSTVVTMATNDLRFDTTGTTGLLTIDATNDRVGIGTASPSNTLHVFANSEDEAAYIQNVTATASTKRGLEVACTGTAGSSSTEALRLTLQATTGANTYSIYSVNGPNRTNNYGALFSLTGSGTNNYGIIGTASGGTSVNYGVVGVAGSTTAAVDGTDTAVQAQLRGSRTNGRAIRAYNFSQTTGTRYGIFCDDFFNNYATSYAIYVLYDSTGDENIGLYLDVKNGTVSNTAILHVGGDVIFNDNTLDLDFTIKSDNNAAMFVVDGSADGIGVGTATPDAAALMEFSSTTKGVILPRMTAAQASAITAVNGLILYVTDTNGTFTSVGFWGYENGAWTKL
jgi:hypothetical protein